MHAHRHMHMYTCIEIANGHQHGGIMFSMISMFNMHVRACMHVMHVCVCVHGILPIHPYPPPSQSIHLPPPQGGGLPESVKI